MFKTFKYRLFPTKAQANQLHRYAAYSRNWWNFCLAEWKYRYEVEGVNTSKGDLSALIKKYRAAMAPDVPWHLFGSRLDEFDEARKAFWKRLKKGDKGGYPKYKSYRNTSPSFGFNKVAGWKLKTHEEGKPKRLYISGIGNIRGRWHRKIEGEPITCDVMLQAGKWYVSVTCRHILPKPLPPPSGRVVGIDVGLHWLMATSDGDFIENPKWYREAQAELRRLQRKAARQLRLNNPTALDENGAYKKGHRLHKTSNYYKTLQRVRKLHAKTRNQRKHVLDVLAHDFTLHYDVVVVEDLSIRNMVKNKHLSKSILDAGWGYFIGRLKEKATEHGCEILTVDARYTSQTCSECGKPFDEKIGLAQRWVTCDCGMSLDRDYNAACNVRNKAVQSLGALT